MLDFILQQKILHDNRLLLKIDFIELFETILSHNWPITNKQSVGIFNIKQIQKTTYNPRLNFEQEASVKIPLRYY